MSNTPAGRLFIPQPERYLQERIPGREREREREKHTRVISGDYRDAKTEAKPSPAVSHQVGRARRNAATK